MEVSYYGWFYVDRGGRNGVLFHPQEKEERNLRPVPEVSRGGTADPLPCGRPVPSGRLAHIREHGPLNG